MKKLFLTSSILILSISPCIAIADQLSINKIEKAGRNFNIDLLQTLALSDNHYDVALSQYRLAICYMNSKSKDDAKFALAKAITELELLLDTDEKNVEALALLSLVYGMAIGISPSLGAEYGPKAERSIAKAKMISPYNPRVNLVTGIHEYFTPKEFGGSQQAALGSLDDAIAYYVNDKDSGYYWGLAEAHVWRGLVQMKLGERGKALGEWRTALSIEPDMYWATELLKKNQ